MPADPDPRRDPGARAPGHRWNAAEQAVRRALPRWLAEGVLLEAWGCRSLWLAARGRRAGAGPGVAEVPYDAGMTSFMALMTVLSGAEIVIIHVAVPWTAVRIALIVVGVLTLVAVVGVWAGMRTRPHLVGRDELRLRSGHQIEVVVPLAQLRSCTPRLDGTVSNVAVVDGCLHVPVMGSTHVRLDLAGELAVPLLYGRRGTATSIALAADDPAAAVRLIRAAMAERTT